MDFLSSLLKEVRITTHFFAENGQISKLTNHSGGILGGLSDGSTILLRAANKAYSIYFPADRKQ